VVGLLVTGMFLTVILAYAVTEHLLTRLSLRQRLVVGQGSPLRDILRVNAVSFLVVWVCSLVLMFAADVHLYYYATLVSLSAQGLCLGQHLWSYYRSNVRLGYE
jgi:hypothetical protein